MKSTITAPTRELARRLSGTVEVLLLWHPTVEQVEVSVCDSVTGVGFHMEVAPGNALDAFHHPYAYAARFEGSLCVVQDRTSVDG